MPPQHRNLHNANKELFWSGTDNLVTHKKNIQDDNSREYLRAHGWLNNDKAISYKYNQHGFRSAEFDQTPSYLALGCSFTEGVGLPEDQIWPFLLSKKLSANVWNLGVGGTSLDTCFRFLDHYINELNIIGVFVLLPHDGRFEIHTAYGILNFNPHWGGDTNDTEEMIKKLWYSESNNSYYNRRKNLLAIEHLCYSKGIKMFTREIDELQTTELSRARDMLHAGHAGHIQVTDLFYQDFKNS